MNEARPHKKAEGVDYAATLFLPKTDFPMRAGLPQKEPELLARWREAGLYTQLREAARGRPQFVVHDGPPYANGAIHIGHALNKVLKDIVAKSKQMMGRDSDYVPGWDCHGLPIEWKVEEAYREKGRGKPVLADAAALIAFRQECRAYAAHWLDAQRVEFERLGVIGDWAHPYSTMSFAAEARIARELMAFAANGLLYRGSKPVMWSVVEKTALAEAEIEYEDYTSDTVYAAFPVKGDGPLGGAKIVIWTTTPWTLPGNRAISYSPKIGYGVYVVDGARYVVADALAAQVFADRDATRVADAPTDALHGLAAAHPLAAMPGYDFDVPLLPGDHVTDDAGTGFVHTAPGHGRDDFEVWIANGRELSARGIDVRIPSMVDGDGFYTAEAPGFEGRRVIDDRGRKGDANEAVFAALAQAGTLVARGTLRHQYPHSWRSKKPVIFRNTPQWFIAMDVAAAPDETLRARALAAIAQTRWEPPSGENRITAMVANRPDWVVSRQRAWGVPIAVFVKRGEHTPLVDERVNARINAAFETEGADAWFADDAALRFLGPDYDPADYEKVDDVLDVWFDSGSTHAFVLDDAEAFPNFAGLKREVDGGRDTVMYLEGSDQHRGFFQSSLLESCGTRGRAPFDIVLTHGFVLDENGRKMSKSTGNVVAPQTVIKDSGADILRLWVASSDFTDDMRIGKTVLTSFAETYKKLRNTLRWMLGALSHVAPGDAVAHADMPELERLMLHRLAELDELVRGAYDAFDFKRVIASLSAFMNTELSAFYFDIRKDALYCDPRSSVKRRAALTVIDAIFARLTVWLAPVLSFTCEEAWLARDPAAASVHLAQFPDTPDEWRDDALAAKWVQIRAVRRVVTGALEVERAAKRIGSSLEAAPILYVDNSVLSEPLADADFAEVCITSGVTISLEDAPREAFRLSDEPRFAVHPARARGVKCARSWKYFDPATADPAYPNVTPRDALALRELGFAGAA